MYQLLGKIWFLLIFCMLTACETTNAKNTEYRYVNEAGEIAVWNIETQTIIYSDDTLKLQSCEAENKHCFKGDWVKIVVPKSCERDEFYGSDDTFKSQHGVNALGLEGLTGGINYFEGAQKKFGYTYHPLRGITKIVLIPSNLPIWNDSGFKIVPYVYYIENYAEDDGPFACVLPNQ